MPKVKRLSEWKPLKLEGSVFSEGIDDLIGIEELTDYKLDKSNKKSRIIICDGKSNEENKGSSKRKALNELREDGTNGREPLKKKVKVKVKEPKGGSRKNKDKNENENENENENKSRRKVKETVANVLSNDTSDAEDQFYTDISSKDGMDGTDGIDAQAWSRLGVPTPVLKALADQRFRSPTTIQALTLAPAILGHRDILGAAETGSGKTLAFGIPIISGILESKKKRLIDSDVEERERKENINVGNQGWTRTSWDGSEDDDCRSSESDFEADVDGSNGNGIGCVRVINNIETNERSNCLKKPLYALILTPTRELAIQVKNHLTEATKYTDIRIAVVVGGMAAVKQERILSKGPEIVIATPGRLWELIQLGNSHLSQVNCIKYLAIDETDRMLEKGHFIELQQLLEKINGNEKMLKERQTFVFSATLTMVHDIPDYLQRKKKRHVKSKIQKLSPKQKLQQIIDLVGIKNPKVVDVTKESGTASNLTECRIACTMDHKDYYLYYFLKRHPGRTLIFCNSIGCVKRLATLFGILECHPLPLHASMPQRQRLKNLERFQADQNGLLVATDVAARGLDIPSVEHVIHYQVPRTSESYVHRSGRTARAQKEGITVLMMEPSEKDNYSKLCRTLGRTQDLPLFPVVDRLLMAVKERVDVAREIDKLELRCRRDNAQKGWLRKAREEMEMITDEDEDEEETAVDMKETADLKHHLKVRKHHLRSLLSKVLFPKGFSGKYPDTNTEVDLKETNQKAVEVMKKIIEEIPKKKRDVRTRSTKKRSLKGKRSKMPSKVAKLRNKARKSASKK